MLFRSRLINKIILGILGSFLDIGVTTELPVRVEPSDATGKDDLNWDTSNPDVISVTSTGQITTHKTGTAVITATAKDGSGVSGQLAIKVHRPIRKIIIDGGDITLKETERKQLTATIQVSRRPNSCAWAASTAILICIIEDRKSVV